MKSTKKAALPGGRKRNLQLANYKDHHRLSNKNFDFSFCPRKIPCKPANRVQIGNYDE